MSLYGALFASVSGLKAQGSKIGIISDNIANINTVGYKAGQAQFETLVTNASSSVAYSPGGVLASNRQLVDKQGLLQSTDSPTDIAISGNGMFVVNGEPDGSSVPLYTRAGSFRQDSLGNFQNAAGFFLQGWPLDREGRLPGEPGNLNTISSANLSSLETVNVKSASGVAAATTLIAIGANLDAGESVFPGAGAIVTFDPLSVNFGITANDIIVGNEYGAASINSIVRGDQFTVRTGAGLSYTYLYGGYAVSRSVEDGTVGDGAANIAPVDLDTVNGGIDPFTTSIGSGTVNVFHTGHGYATGDVITIDGVAADVDDIPAAQLNGQHVITVIDADNYEITVSSPATAGLTGGGAGITATDRLFTGNIMDADSATEAFLGETGVSGFTTASRSFTVTTATSGTVTFTYTTASPNPVLGQFNNLTNLAAAINEVNGLTARVEDGRLYIGAVDANEAITFANSDDVGTSTLAGIDWVEELDLVDIAASSSRFSTLQGLANLVEDSEGLGATISNALSDATLEIHVDDPLDTIRMEDFASDPVDMPDDSLTIPATAAGLDVDIVVADPSHTFNVGDTIIVTGATAGAGGLTAPQPNGTYQIVSVNAGVDYTYRIVGGGGAGGIAGAAAVGGTSMQVAQTNTGSLLAEFGIVDSLASGAYVQGDTGELGPKYDSSGSIGENMSSGDITADFSRNIRVYDSLGTGHDMRTSFLKIGQNTWAVEVHVIPEDDVNTTLVDGQVAVGTIVFNGDGSLRSISAGLSLPVTVNWINGSEPSEITFDWGTAGQPFGTAGATQIGLTDGLSQFDSDYNVAFVEQNGSQVGSLISVAIDEEGYVIASYSNGETQKLYKLPIADFANPNGLKNISGNVFAQTEQSGEVNLREAGSNGVGDVVSAALEASNVELSEQLTDLIVAQRAYQANTKVITTTDDLLDQLNRI